MHNTADLRFPADSAYVAAVRLTTAALAVRIGFSIEDVEDTRIAVSEACALLFEAQGAVEAGPADTLDIRYDLADDHLGVHISTPVYGDLDATSFGWQLLNAVTSELSTEITEGRRYVHYVSKPATRSE